MKENTLLRTIAIIALILLFLTGLSVLLYPMISDYVNSLSQTRVISQYTEKLSQLSETDYSDIIEAAREYNKKLLTKQNRFKLSDEDLLEYHSVLDFTGTGVIGTLEIDMIKVKLPIYLGTDEDILQVGIGHLEGSSLPVGGPGTHSVISGHRGLPSSTLLTDIDKMEIGDVFVLKILNEVLTYEIDHRVIVDPDNFDYLGIDPEMDYCTLFTCTPYGINSHRLLLRGHRIFPDNPEQPAADTVLVLNADARRVGVIAEYVVAAVPIIAIILLYMFFKYAKSKTKSKSKSIGRR